MATPSMVSAVSELTGKCRLTAFCAAATAPRQDSVKVAPSGVKESSGTAGSSFHRRIFYL
jgi:hypothetical protein